MKLSGYTTHLCSNPIYYYVAVSFKSGKIELLKSDPKTNYLELIAKLVLCDEELSSVLFFRDGENCIVNSFPSGRFYYVSVSKQRPFIFPVVFEDFPLSLEIKNSRKISEI